MAQIIVAGDGQEGFGEAAETLRERITPEDLESEHFAEQLMERVGWAVHDAVEPQIDPKLGRRPS
jgi:hypothetical protein